MRVALLAVLAAACSSEPSEPAPQVHAVGVVTLELVDPTRATPANGGVPAHAGRSLPTELWYPATGSPGNGETFAADLDPRGKPFPLVVFVHGSSGFRRQSTFLMRALAEAGYVVASADYPLTTLLQPGGASDEHADDQVGDVRFVASEVARFAADPEEALAGAVDRSQGFAVLGHSTGGTVALASAFSSSATGGLVRAAVAYAPCACFFAPTFFRSRAVPLLVMAGTNDRYVPPASNGRYAYDEAGPPKLFVSLKGGSHLRFTDFDADDTDVTPTTDEDALAKAFAADGGGTRCTPFPPIGVEPAMTLDEQHLETIRFTKTFLDAHLRGKPAALAAAIAATDPLVSVEHAEK